MKVFIANFGRHNYAWSQCLERGTVATMNSVAVQPLWGAGDREAYIQHSVRHAWTALGTRPTRSVASRWFNLMTIISETSGDIWMHREKEQFWWTRSKPDAAVIEPGVDPTLTGDQRVFICHKPCEPWSNRSLKGNRLEWNSLHPRAKEFLFTEGTLQQLNEDNAEYAVVLIEGGDLSSWHSRPDWSGKLGSARARPGIVFSPRQRAIARMADTALATAAMSNGQEVIRTLKDKQIGFDKTELEKYLSALIYAQEGLCALTGLKLEFDDHADKERWCSLDRIDSSGHYRDGNLQVVCRFANRWKNDGSDAEFKRLLEIVRSVGSEGR
ncbi:MAG: hypothetical protein JWN71_1118 [Xanthobacteraceae bacterium]|nr:hypothetical protein [Xanthobacteraceae bacterium]